MQHGHLFAILGPCTQHQELISQLLIFPPKPPADRLVLLTPDMDPAVLAWGPLSGQRQAWLRRQASYLLRSLRLAAADALAEMMADPA